MPTANPGKKVTENNSLKVGGQRCIDFLIRGKNSGKAGNTSNAQTHILIAKYGGTANNQPLSNLCRQVQNSEPLKAYFSSTVNGSGANSNNGKGAVAIGSSISIYEDE